MSNTRPVSDLRRLRALVEVARTGSVSEAAVNLHLSQPAVSLQLKALSEETGLVLFSRGARGLKVTREGEALLQRAEAVLNGLTEFNRAASGLHQSVRGHLRIGTILDPEFIRLGPFLQALVQAAPQIETELRQAISGRVLEDVATGVLDVGFCLIRTPVAGESPAHAGAASSCVLRTLSTFTYRVVGPPGWQIKMQGLGWTELAGLPWLGTPELSAHHMLLSAVFGPGSLTSLSPKRVAFVDQEASMLDLVKSGVGLSLMRDSIALREKQVSGLAVSDKVSIECTLAFACQRSNQSAPVVSAAVEALEKVWSVSPVV